jgi:MFS family permease
VAAGCFLLSAGGLGLFLAGATGGPIAVVATCLVGLSIGAEIDLLAFLTTRYFGMRRFGWNYGVMFIAFLLGTATGPLTYAAVHDATQNYDVALGVAALLVFACAATMFTLPEYRSRHA